MTNRGKAEQLEAIGGLLRSVVRLLDPLVAQRSTTERDGQVWVDLDTALTAAADRIGELARFYAARCDRDPR